MKSARIVVVGGGAAGFFAAIACAEARPGAEVMILEKTAHFLAKVKISGGGRCNVTHACFEPREFARRYPRGERALISALQKFSARDTVTWFAERGVELKTEADGRMFPVTDSSQTIVDCLQRAAANAGVVLKANCEVANVAKLPGGFGLKLTNGTAIACDCLLIATGGCRTAALAQLAVSLGHKLEPPVPSLFTFHIAASWLGGLAGVAVEDAEAAIANAGIRQRGAMLITHWGVSGPAILRLSAWGARWLHEQNYRFSLLVNWLPNWTDEKLADEFASRRRSQPAKLCFGKTGGVVGHFDAPDLRLPPPRSSLPSGCETRPAGAALLHGARKSPEASPIQSTSIRSKPDRIPSTVTRSPT